MTYEDRAKVIALASGWGINDLGDFERQLPSGEADIMTMVSPSDPGGWGMLCNVEGIDVPVDLSMHESRARVTALAYGWSVSRTGDFERPVDGSQGIVTSISPSDPGGWGMLCDAEGIEVPDTIDAETVSAMRVQKSEPQVYGAGFTGMYYVK